MIDEPADTLPDVLEDSLTVVFCGTAPGNVSASLGEYYAHTGNKFWGTLYATGLIPVELKAADFRQVTQYGIGLTDVAKKHSGVDANIPAEAYDAEALRQKIDLYKPKVLAFTSKRAACEFLGLKDTALVDYGRQDRMVGTTELWVLPSPSGQATIYWDDKYWQDLSDRVAELRKS